METSSFGPQSAATFKLPIANLRSVFRTHDVERKLARLPDRDYENLRTTYERMLERGPERFQVKPGRHIVGIAGDDEGSGLCAMQIGQPVKETASEVAAGEVQKYRISGTQNGTDIRPSSL